MILQIIITSVALVALATVWLFVQRLTYVEMPDASGDYLEGRWGCGDCSITDDCVLKQIVDQRETSATADQSPPP